MALVKFNENKKYNDIVYKKGLVYELKGQDYINRWIRRGCEVLKEHNGSVYSDPRDGEVRDLTPPLLKEIEKKVAKEEIAEKEDVAEKEVKVIKKVTKKKVTKKAVAKKEL